MSPKEECAHVCVCVCLSVCVRVSVGVGGNDNWKQMLRIVDVSTWFWCLPKPGMQISLQGPFDVKDRTANLRRFCLCSDQWQ